MNARRNVQDVYAQRMKSDSFLHSSKGVGALAWLRNIRALRKLDISKNRQIDDSAVESLHNALLTLARYEWRIIHPVEGIQCPYERHFKIDRVLCFRTTLKPKKKERENRKESGMGRGRDTVERRVEKLPLFLESPEGKERKVVSKQYRT